MCAFTFFHHPSNILVMSRFLVTLFFLGLTSAGKEDSNQWEPPSNLDPSVRSEYNAQSNSGRESNLNVQDDRGKSVIDSLRDSDSLRDPLSSGIRDVTEKEKMEVARNEDLRSKSRGEGKFQNIDPERRSILADLERDHKDKESLDDRVDEKMLPNGDISIPIERDDQGESKIQTDIEQPDMNLKNVDMQSRKEDRRKSHGIHEHQVKPLMNNHENAAIEEAYNHKERHDGQDRHGMDLENLHIDNERPKMLSKPRDIPLELPEQRESEERKMSHLPNRFDEDSKKPIDPKELLYKDHGKSPGLFNPPEDKMMKNSEEEDKRLKSDDFNMDRPHPKDIMRENPEENYRDSGKFDNVGPRNNFDGRNEDTRPPSGFTEYSKDYYDGKHLKPEEYEDFHHPDGTPGFNVDSKPTNDDYGEYLHPDVMDMPQGSLDPKLSRNDNDPNHRTLGETRYNQEDKSEAKAAEDHLRTLEDARKEDSSIILPDDSHGPTLNADSEMPKTDDDSKEIPITLNEEKLIPIFKENSTVMPSHIDEPSNIQDTTAENIGEDTKVHEEEKNSDMQDMEHKTTMANFETEVIPTTMTSIEEILARKHPDMEEKHIFPHGSMDEHPFIEIPIENSTKDAFSNESASNDTSVENNQTQSPVDEPTLKPDDVTTQKEEHVKEQTTIASKEPIFVPDDDVRGFIHKDQDTHRQNKQIDLSDPSDCQCTKDSLVNAHPLHCTNERVVPQPGCPCRSICSKQAGESCSLMEPCDLEFGLTCDPEAGMCLGHLYLIPFDITHNSVSIRWNSPLGLHPSEAKVSTSTNYTDGIWTSVENDQNPAILSNLKPNTNYYIKVVDGDYFEIAKIRTKDGCTINETTSVAVGETFFIGCEEKCTCWSTGSKECHERCRFRPGLKSDPLCEEQQDPEDSCCVVYNCKDKNQPATAKLLVTGRTPSSLTIAWDDFKLKSSQSGYLVGYREAVTDSNKEEEWNWIKPGTLPFMTLTRLKPRTTYQVIVSATDDQEGGNIGTSSEVITVETEDGCLKYNRTYEVGEVMTQDCDPPCMCKPNGESECRDRCVPPLFPIGSHQNVSYCVETVSSEDTCCATIKCEVKEDQTHEEHTEDTTSELPMTEMPSNLTEPITPPIADESTDALSDVASVLAGPILPHHPLEEEIERKVNTSNVGDVVSEHSDQSLSEQAKSHPVAVATQSPSSESEDHPLISPEGDAEKEAKMTPDVNPDLRDESEQKTKSQDSSDLGVSLEAINALNSTSIKIQISVEGKEETKPDSLFHIWYSDQNDNNAVSWTKKSVTIDDMEKIDTNKYEIDIDDLQPSTTYYVKVATKVTEKVIDSDNIDGGFTNTLSVKTFPPGVKTSFKGCFVQNHSYEIGEVFYEGCEHKCICRENGHVECQDRCKMYVDNVGFEGCEWGPSEEDPCCIEPHCESRGMVEKTPLTTPPPFCILGAGNIRHVGEMWQVGEGCRRRVCRCLLNNNGSAHVDCQGGCPPLPPNAHLPTRDCREPVLVRPNDPCLCPYIVCGRQSQHMIPPVPMCEFKGKRYDMGQEFYDDCRGMCHCGQDLRVNCAAIECPYHFDSRLSECLEWDVDPNFVPIPPKCCAPAKCKNDGSCMYKGNKYSNYQSIPQKLLDCGERCVCVSGNVTCESQCPPINEVPPRNLPCPPALAYKGHAVEDSCCLRWLCREPERRGQELQNVNIVPINDTAARIRFSLPGVLVGLIGHAEVHYTTDPTLPPADWKVQKFSRPNRLFDSPNIEYYLKGLMPDTEYFMAIRTVLEAMKGGPQSDVHKVRMPPVMTTTSTMPPEITIDTMLAVHPLDANTIKVSWKELDAQEKRFVYGVQLRYKRSGQGDGEWQTTPMIHRDVTSYIIHDLEPAATYDIDLVFTTPEGVPTKVESTGPAHVTTLESSKEEYNFQVSISENVVEPYSVEFSVNGIPEPVSNYVHVIKAVYKSDMDGEQSHVFKIPHAEKIVLDHLTPAHRYKMHLELFLKNGKIITSNEIEFLTKEAPVDDNVIESVPRKGKLVDLPADPLQDAENKAYFVALIVVAVVAAVAAFGFILLLILLVRRQASAKANISRTPSESAYDNPTYKSTEGDKQEEKSYRQIIQP